MEVYLFLDVDGVFNIPSCQEGDTENWQFDPECLYQFGELMQRCNIHYGAWPRLIISSSWRTGNVEKTKAKLAARGFTWLDSIMGETIRAYRYIDKAAKIHLSIPRGVEIKQWLDTRVHSDNGKNWERKTPGKDFMYLIIDDEDDMLLEQQAFFVQTAADKGFTSAERTACLDLINIHRLAAKKR